MRSRERIKQQQSGAGETHTHTKLEGALRVGRRKEGGRQEQAAALEGANSKL